jgi:hypothetical protein
LEFGVWSLEFGVWSLEFGVWSLEFGVWKKMEKVAQDRMAKKSPEGAGSLAQPAKDGKQNTNEIGALKARIIIQVGSLHPVPNSDTKTERSVAIAAT